MPPESLTVAPAQTVLTDPASSSALKAPPLQLLVSDKGDVVAILQHDGADLREAGTQKDIGFLTGTFGQLKMACNGNISMSMFNDHGQLGRWHVADLSRFRLLTLPDLPSVAVTPGMLAFETEGNKLAVAGPQELCFYNASRRTLTWKYDDDAIGAGRLVALSPDGGVVAVTRENGTVQLLETAKGAPLEATGNYSAPVQAIALAPNGTLLAAGLGDDGFDLRDPTGGHPPRAYAYRVAPKADALVFSADGQWLAVIAPPATLDEDFRIGIFNAATGALCWEIQHHGADPATEQKVVMAFAPDGKTFYTAAQKLESWTLK
ncbi:MAG: hypothetical protein ABSH19_09865 [Opitutales bacterium]